MGRVALLVLLASLPAAATAEVIDRHKTCDGRWRHYACHWSGGDRTTERDVPPDELLGYGQPTLSSTERGRLHIIVGACEITCEAGAIAASPDPHSTRDRPHGR